jgi:hypothetical protein
MSVAGAEIENLREAFFAVVAEPLMGKGAVREEGGREWVPNVGCEFGKRGHKERKCNVGGEIEEIRVQQAGKDCPKNQIGVECSKECEIELGIGQFARDRERE